eukprot:scaffold1087_cov198-Pinguiococcus_pyrenoidosus.AAC.34
MQQQYLEAFRSKNFEALRSFLSMLLLFLCLHEINHLPGLLSLLSPGLLRSARALALGRLPAPLLVLLGQPVQAAGGLHGRVEVHVVGAALGVHVIQLLRRAVGVAPRQGPDPHLACTSPGEDHLAGRLAEGQSRRSCGLVTTAATVTQPKRHERGYLGNSRAVPSSPSASYSARYCSSTPSISSGVGSLAAAVE